MSNRWDKKIILHYKTDKSVDDVGNPIFTSETKSVFAKQNKVYTKDFLNSNFNGYQLEAIFIIRKENYNNKLSGITFNDKFYKLIKVENDNIDFVTLWVGSKLGEIG